MDAKFIENDIFKPKSIDDIKKNHLDIVKNRMPYGQIKPDCFTTIKDKKYEVLITYISDKNIYGYIFRYDIKKPQWMFHKWTYLGYSTVNIIFNIIITEDIQKYLDNISKTHKFVYESLFKSKSIDEIKINHLKQIQRVNRLHPDVYTKTINNKYDVIITDINLVALIGYIFAYDIQYPQWLTHKWSFDGFSTTHNVFDINITSEIKEKEKDILKSTFYVSKNIMENSIFKPKTNIELSKEEMRIINVLKKILIVLEKNTANVTNLDLAQHIFNKNFNISHDILYDINNAIVEWRNFSEPSSNTAKIIITLIKNFLNKINELK